MLKAGFEIGIAFALQHRAHLLPVGFCASLPGQRDQFVLALKRQLTLDGTKSFVDENIEITGHAHLAGDPADLLVPGRAHGFRDGVPEQGEC